MLIEGELFGMKPIETVIDRLSIWSAYLAGATVLVMAFSVGAEIVNRALFRRGYDWLFELNNFLIVALVYLGAPYAVRLHGHVRIDLVSRLLPQRAQTVLDVVAQVAGLIVVSALVWQASLLALESYRLNVRSQTVLWQVYPVQSLIVVGAVLTVLQHLLHLIKLWLGGLKAATATASDELADLVEKPGLPVQIE